MAWKAIKRYDVSSIATPGLFEAVAEDALALRAAMDADAPERRASDSCGEGKQLPNTQHCTMRCQEKLPD